MQFFWVCGFGLLFFRVEVWKLLLRFWVSFILGLTGLGFTQRAATV